MTNSERIREYRLRQPLAELARKRRKAARRAMWTQEDVDHTFEWARRMAGKLKMLPQAE